MPAESDRLRPTNQTCTLRLSGMMYSCLLDVGTLRDARRVAGGARPISVRIAGGLAGGSRLPIGSERTAQDRVCGLQRADWARRRHQWEPPSGRAWLPRLLCSLLVPVVMGVHSS